MHQRVAASRRTGRGRTRIVSLAVLVGLLATPLPPPAPVAAVGGTVSLAFRPAVDTYVSEDSPDKSYAAVTAMYVDATPLREGYLRFDVTGLRGRTVTRVRLRMLQKDTDGSPVGGEVRALSDTTWPEEITWRTRPRIDGPLVGAFEAVFPGYHYEADLDPSVVTGDGPLSLAITSWHDDAAVWTTREGLSAAQLIVDVVADPWQPVDGVRPLVDDLTGSSDPTYFGNAHRLARTAGGRLLAVHGKHANGVQLQWRDPGGTWQTRSRGDTADGLLVADAGTGDVPASIVVARDRAGAEHAWIAWAGASLDGRPLELRRISDLDHPQGPSIGPRSTLDADASARPDIAAEIRPDGSGRLFVAYTRAAGAVSQLVVRVIDDLGAVKPRASAAIVLHEDRSTKRTATLVATPAGMRAIAIVDGGRVAAFRHQAGSSVRSWSRAASDLVTIGNRGFPSAAALDRGQIISAVTSDGVNDIVAVQRFGRDGRPAAVEATFRGYTDPTIANDGTRAWVVMIRTRDGSLVSRERDPSGLWSGRDRVERPARDGAAMTFPNALREGRRLHVLVSIPGDTDRRSAVLEVVRTPPPLPDDDPPAVRRGPHGWKHAPVRSGR